MCNAYKSTLSIKSAVLATRKPLNPTNHTAANVAETLQDIFLEWSVLHKITTIVTDNDATMKKACDLLKIKHLPCFAHTLILLVQEVLKVQSFSEIMNKCKRIVTFFKSSTIATEKFKIAQAVSVPYTLIQEVPTRWKSVFFYDGKNHQDS